MRNYFNTTKIHNVWLWNFFQDSFRLSPIVLCVFFVVQRSTFIIPETDNTVFNIIKFTLDARTKNCMKWVGERVGGGEEDNVSIGTIGRRVVLVDTPRGIIFPRKKPGCTPSRPTTFTVIIVTGNGTKLKHNNPEVTLIQCAFAVLYLLCQLSKPHAKNL